jgi:hypothetical protein
MDKANHDGQGKMTRKRAIKRARKIATKEGNVKGQRRIVEKKGKFLLLPLCDGTMFQIQWYTYLGVAVLFLLFDS